MARRALRGPPRQGAAHAGPAAPQAPLLMAAKAYRLLRAVLTTAVEEDKILARNPCRIRGAREERAAERPVLTVGQVFELADRVGHRPVGNIRKLPWVREAANAAKSGHTAVVAWDFELRPDI